METGVEVDGAHPFFGVDLTTKIEERPSEYTIEIEQPTGQTIEP
jgi:hypothetical protein